MTANEEFETNHKDRVTCLHINYDGTKIVTGSIDHRVNVWSVSPKTQERTLVDTWTAHDADIRDAKWLHPSTGTRFGTVGNDLKFHLWGEEPSQAPNSGRRFKKLSMLNSPNKVPFVSLDFRNVDSVYTYLAIIDRQGLLSIYEPANPDEFKEWTLIDRWNVAVPVPSRGDQTSFKVRWDQNVMPLPYVCGINDDRRQLSLVVTAGNDVKIYRGVTSDDHKSPDNTLLGDGEASHRITFYEAAKLPAHPSLIRDVAWAPFNVRGTDLFATACKDGGVRIFEMAVTAPFESHHNHHHSLQKSQSSTTDPALTPTMLTPNKTPQQQTLTRQQTQSSNLTSAIASRSTSQTQTQTQPSNTSNAASPSAANVSPTVNATSSRHTYPRTTYTFPYRHTVSLVANLGGAHEDAWSVSWDPNGQVLLSGGADGSTKIWRRSVLDVDAVLGESMGVVGGGGGKDVGSGGGGGAGLGGKWLLFADQAVSFGDEREQSEDDDDANVDG